MNYSFNVSTKVQIGGRQVLKEQLLSIVKSKKCLFFTSANMLSRLELQDLVAALQNQCDLQLIQYSVVNPTEIDIKNVLQKLNKKPEVIIALGGGSILDLSKGVSVFSYLLDEIIDEELINSLIKNKSYLNHKSPIEIIALPTTSGTGTEVTRWATIWNYRGNEKLSIEAEWLLPTYAFIIPEFTCYLSARQTLSTGLDALMHAVESYWSINSNVLIRELAKASIRLIVDYLPKVLSESDNVCYREKLSLGSILAGLSFSNTRTTACHSISYPLTMNYGIEHGFAAAITLTEMIKFNRDYIVDYPFFLEAFHAECEEDIEKWLHMCVKDLQPLHLRNFGIDKKELYTIVEKSFTVGRMNNNPRQCTREDVYNILLSSI